MSLSAHTRTRLLWRNGKRVRAHRWIMEQKLDRKLSPTEVVHHINGNPLDNRIENLRVLDAAEHIRLHKEKYPKEKNCEVCGNIFTPSPFKRKRQKCCSEKCAQSIRVQAALKARGLLASE